MKGRELSMGRSTATRRPKTWRQSTLRNVLVEALVSLEGAIALQKRERKVRETGRCTRLARRYRSSTANTGC